MDLLHAHCSRSAIRGPMMPLRWSILDAQMIYFCGSTTSTIQLKCGKHYKADWTTQQIRSVELTLFARFMLYTHRMVRRFTQYFTRLINLRKELIGSPETISNETMKIDIFSTLPKEFETTINLLAQQIPVPTAQQVMDRLRDDVDQTEFAKEVIDESTGSGLYNWHRRGGGNFGRDRGKDDKEYSCTYCKMKIQTAKAVAFAIDSTAEVETLAERSAR